MLKSTNIQLANTAPGYKSQILDTKKCSDQKADEDKPTFKIQFYIRKNLVEIKKIIFHFSLNLWHTVMYNDYLFSLQFYIPPADSVIHMIKK